MKITKQILTLLLALVSTPVMAAQTTATLTEDGTTCVELRTKSLTASAPYFATISADGTWSGTLAYNLSYDGGTTSQAITDVTGVAETATSDETFNMELGRAAFSQTEPQLCMVVSGATSPSIIVRITDNN